MATKAVAFLKALGGLPNTFWGIVILLLSMLISMFHDIQVGYYFAGIGSTLVGIQHTKKENPDAGNPPSQD